MPAFPRVTLRQNKIDAVKRFHPWIFSGAIKRTDVDVKEGAIVEAYSESGDYLATGFFSPGSIAIKIVSFQQITSIADLFQQRFRQAYALREQLGLTDNPGTTGYRLINSEGDGLPGLIVDWYNGTAVLQAYSLGMYEHRDLIAQCLQTVYGSRLQAIYDKSGAVLGKSHSLTQNQYLSGTPASHEITESGHRFSVDWEEGQKTGFFLDQRQNRQLLASYAQGRRVLNTFCYSGGFSVYATQAGAEVVHSVDSSTRAIAWAEENVAHNNPQQVPHQAFATDVFEFLKHCDADYDLIILDPPAFAKSLSARHQAVMAYKRLNHLALAKLQSGGLLFTFSCSQVVNTEHFQGAVTAAAIEAGRTVRVLHHLSQPPDHPVSIYHPEGLYLKGLVLRVD